MAASDNKQFPKLLAHDEALGVNAQIYTGDRAYDDTDLHYRLWESDKFSAFSLNDHRTNKKDDTQRSVAACGELTSVRGRFRRTIQG